MGLTEFVCDIIIVAAVVSQSIPCTSAMANRTFAKNETRIYDIRRIVDVLMNHDHQRKTLCFVTSSLQGGGAQRVLVNIANRFARDGWRTHLICFVAKNNPPIYSVDSSIQLHYLPRGYTIKDRILPPCVKMLQALVAEISPDVLIPFLMPATAYTFIVARNLKIKIIVSERNDPMRTPTDPYWRKQRDYIITHADGCVFQTQSACDYFKGNMLSKYAIIRNPVDLSVARSDIVKAKERTKRIVCIGKYEPQKNLEFLLEVFAEFLKTHPNYTLEVYGNDYHHRRLPLQQKAIALGIDDKVYLNDARSDIFDVIYDARMCVLPSKYEGMPNALIESVSLGVPSIASDCPTYGGRQVITSGENGYLVPVDDKNAFVDKMCCIADQDLLADHFTEEGRKVSKKFDIDEVYALWRRFVLDVLNA